MFLCAVPIMRNQIGCHLSDRKVCYRESMGDHLKNILRGLGEGLTIAPPSRGYRIDSRGFLTDARKLRGDFVSVGGDMRRVLKRDQQAYERSRKG